MRSRIDGFDYLRAMMSIFVVIWHMGGGGRSLIFSKEEYLNHIFSISDFVNFNIFLLAVPTFIFLSNFLYALKRSSYTALKKRLKRIILLLTFWPVALILYRGGYAGIIRIMPDSISSFIIITLRAGNTLYYFFVSLLFCFFITHLVGKRGKQFQLIGFILSAIFLAFLPELTKITDIYQLSAYWSPLNFIPYSFAAVIVSQNLDYIYLNKKKLLFVSSILCVLHAVFEWNNLAGGIFFHGQGFAIPAYTRTSLLFGVLTIAIIALSPSIKTNTIIDYMSKYSLALFCLHPFFMDPVKKISGIILRNEIVSIYFSIILVVLLSYFSGMLLRKYFLKDEIII